MKENLQQIILETMTNIQFLVIIMTSERKENDTNTDSGFIPGNTGSDSCSDDQVWGDPSTVYSYILKPRMKPEDEWDAQCDPLYHKTSKD